MDNAALRPDILQLASELKELGGPLPGAKVFAGFDAAVDCIARPVRTRSRDGSAYFESIAEFGEYLVGKRNVSCAIELDIKATKIGGNMPNFIQALGKLGLRSASVGMYGEPVKIEYAPLREYSELHSFSDTLYATALEFNDGKVMLAPGAALGRNGWDAVIQKVGLEPLLEAVETSQIVALLNWGEMPFMHEIWQGFLEHAPLNGKTVFMDLADCSKRDERDIAALVSLVQSFAGKTRTILGLNENEARWLSETILAKPFDPFSTCKELSGKLFAAVAIHTVSGAGIWSCGEYIYADTLRCPFPKLSTGGGDNFNAGFCLGVALGLPARKCIILGNALSSFYVINGKNASFEELQAHLIEWSNGLLTGISN